MANVIDQALTNKTLSKAELSIFAGGAATRTGNLAGDVVARVVALADVVAPGDLTVRKNIGVNALKAIAPFSPDAGLVVATRLIDASSLFSSDDAKTDLAKALAKGISTSAPTAGFAVAGVAQKLATQTPAKFAALGAAVIPAATKAALNIAKELAVVLGTSPDYVGFAKTLALDSRITSATAPSVVAGIAVTAPSRRRAAGLRPDGRRYRGRGRSIEGCLEAEAGRHCRRGGAGG